MKVGIEFIGYVRTLANHDAFAEVEMPGDRALTGDILAELGKRYDERFTTLVIDEKNRVINVVAMKDDKIIVYDTPVNDGARIQLTVMMDGG